MHYTGTVMSVEAPIPARAFTAAVTVGKMAGMDVSEIRRTNLRGLAKRMAAEEGSPDQKGVSALANRTKRAQAQISHIIGDSPRNKPIGDKLARDIERELSLPHGWLDTLQKGPQQRGLRNISVWEEESDLPAESYVLLRRLDVKLAAGHGTHVEGEPQRMNVGQAFRADFVRRKGWTALTHFSVLCTGNSMEPTINDGDSVIVDVSDRVVRLGTKYVYAIRIGDDVKLKRLTRLVVGTILVESDNTSKAEYKSFEIPAETTENCEVLGRAVWRGGDL